MPQISLQIKKKGQRLTLECESDEEDDPVYLSCTRYGNENSTMMLKKMVLIINT